MNAFETFLLDLAKTAIVTAPEILPIFVKSSKGIAIANVSEEFLGAFLQVANPPAAPAAAPQQPAVSVKVG